MDFLDHLRRIDRAIGWFVDHLEEEAAVLMLSDHGFERLDADLYVNEVLRENGFLYLDDEKRGLSGISDRSVAFALDPGRIYVHAADRFPRGRVVRKEMESVVEELISVFTDVEVEGRRAIRSLHRRDEIYRGPAVSRAPDLVLVGDHGVNLKARLGPPAKGADDPFTGKHSQPDAFLLVVGVDEEYIPKHPNVVDVAHIVDHVARGG
jgi:predicted AlkP superfamily phosphohydrolase/phosphomutase